MKRRTLCTRETCPQKPSTGKDGLLPGLEPILPGFHTPYYYD